MGGAAKQKPFTFIDLFAGCGGLTEGFLQSGNFEALAHVVMPWGLIPLMPGICSATLAKMAKGRDVTVSTLTRICEALECNIGDIVDVDVATEPTESKRRTTSRQRVHAKQGN